MAANSDLLVPSQKAVRTYVSNNSAAVAHTHNIGDISGMVTAYQTEIDFGSTPVAEGTFTITNAAVAVGSYITAQVAYLAPTGKDLDEIEMDDLIIRCGSGAGTFDMFVRAADGSYLEGKFKINYTF
jgi:hypothetical protein